MIKRVTVLALGVLLGLLFTAGCASYNAQTLGRGVGDAKRFFVQSNLNDNHAIDRQLVAALKLRERTADNGPLTMMPDDAQVIVSYEDQWTWDFGDHLLYLQLRAQDRRTGQPLATVVFRARIPTKRPLADILGELTDRLLAAPKK